MLSKLDLSDTSVLATLAVGAIGLVGALVFLSSRGSKTPRPGELLPGEKRDTVYFYAFAPWKHGPSASAPCLKLEAYLRLAKIEYVHKKTLKGHPRTKKLPYIRYNGECIYDSNFIISYLVKKAGTLDMDAHVSAEQLAINRAAASMAEDSLYFCVVVERWVNNIDNFSASLHDAKSPPYWLFRLIFRYLVRPGVQKQVYFQGTARLTNDQIEERVDGQLKAFSGILGTKDFFGGDKPCTADLTIFANLSTMYYVPWSKLGLLLKKYNNLAAYVERMQSLAFPELK